MGFDFEIASGLITLVLGGGGGAALFSLVKSIYERRSGKTDRERQHNKETLDELRRKASESATESDKERTKRLEAERRAAQAEETLSYLRRVALEHGVTPTEVYKIINPRKDS